MERYLGKLVGSPSISPIRSCMITVIYSKIRDRKKNHRMVPRVNNTCLWGQDFVESMFMTLFQVLMLSLKTTLIEHLQRWETHQRRNWQPTPVLLPRYSHGQRSLAGQSPRSGKESDTTEQLSTHTHSVRIAMKKRAPSDTHWTEILQYLLCLTHSWVFCFYKNIYLLGCALFAHAGSSVFVMACKLLVAAYGIQLPNWELNPGPLHWGHGGLTIGPPGKSLGYSVDYRLFKTHSIMGFYFFFFLIFIFLLVGG